jgi:hypothetical protein
MIRNWMKWWHYALIIGLSLACNAENIKTNVWVFLVLWIHCMRSLFSKYVCPLLTSSCGLTDRWIKERRTTLTYSAGTDQNVTKVVAPGRRELHHAHFPIDYSFVAKVSIRVLKISFSYYRKSLLSHFKTVYISSSSINCTSYEPNT